MNNGDSDIPPPIESMFINSTDTLKHSEISQKIPPEWNDRPPLFPCRRPERRRPFWMKGQPQHQHSDEKKNNKEEDEENPILLKGVSSRRKGKLSS